MSDKGIPLVNAIVLCNLRENRHDAYNYILRTTCTLFLSQLLATTKFDLEQSSRNIAVSCNANSFRYLEPF